LGATAAITISKLERSVPVDFAREVLPILRNNCLACHNQTAAKAELVLETPQSILKGSENGPVINPGRSEASLLLQVASHQAKPFMPPHNNKVAAVDLAPSELGLLKLWIDQGARGQAPRNTPVEWQPLAETYNPIYAVALTPDGQIAACNRANRIFIYHLPSRRLLTCLADPHLPKPRGTPYGVAHYDSVHALAFSPDGNVLASGGYREAKLWRRPRSVQTFRLPARGETVSAVALSPDGHYAAIGARDGRITVIELPEGQVIQTLTDCPQPLRCLQFGPDNAQLLGLCGEDVVRIWNLADGRVLTASGIECALTAACWIEGGRTLCTGTSAGLIRVGAIPCRGQRLIFNIAELQLGQGEILSLNRIPHCPEQIVAGGADGVVRACDVQNGAVIRTMNHGAPILALAASADRRHYASVGLDRSVALWAAENGQEIARLRGDQDAQRRVASSERTLCLATNEIAYCQTAFELADKERKAQTDRVRKATEALATAEKGVGEKRGKLTEATNSIAAAEKALQDIQAAASQAKATWDAAETMAQQTRLEVLACLQALAEAGTPSDSESMVSAQTRAETLTDELLARASAAGQAKLAFERIAAETKASQKQAEEKLSAARKQAQEAEAEFKKAAQGRANAENELTLAIASSYKASQTAGDAANAVPVAQAEAKRLLAELELLRRTAAQSAFPIRAAAFSPDSLVLGTAAEDGLVQTWSAQSGEPFETLRGQGAPVAALAFRTRDELVALSADGAVLGWNLRPEWSLELVLGTGDDQSPVKDRVNALAFSPDGQTLATGSGEPSRSGQIQMWNVRTGRLTKEFNTVHSDTVLGLEFSRNGQSLASSSADRFMKISDVSDGRIARVFEGHTHHVLGVAWAEDGRSLATAGADNVVKLWDFRSGERRKTIDGFEKEVTSISGVAGGQFLAASGDHQVRLLNDKGELVRAFSGGKGFVYTGAATSDGKLVVAGGDDGVLRVWNGLTGELSAELE
jgi:WD40 repeat protein